MRKSQLQIIDSSLFLYGALVTFFLVITAFLNLKSLDNVLVFIFFLPVAVYFSAKIFSLLKIYFQNILNLDRQNHPYFDSFSISNFINQTEPSFLINLVLLCFALVLILFRISIEILK